MRFIGHNAAIAVAYWALGYAVAIFFQAFGLFPAPNWPSASVALAAALLGGPRLWPGIFIGSFLSNYTLFDAPAQVAAAISVTNTLGPAVGALLIRRLCGTTLPFFRFRDVVIFMLFGAALHGLIAASGGVLASYVGGVLPAEVVFSAWLRWCLADAGGALFFGPALLLWWQDRTLRLSRPQALELGAVGVVTLLLAAAAFFLIEADHHSVSGLPYLLVAPLLWVTVRFSPRAGTTLFSAVAVVATIATVGGLGPFNLAGADRPLVTLGLMVVSLSIGVLFIGSLTAERRAAMGELEKTNRELEARVAARTADLVRANRAKDDFLTTMSHEMRTPLTALLGNAELLLADPLPPPQRERAERMSRSGGLLLSLINDLLDLARIEAGRLELELRPTSVHEVTRHTVQMFEAAAAGKGLALHCDCHDVPPWVLADGKRLQQLLVNLIGNAVKFTERGEVRVDVAPLDDDAETAYLCFTVTDTGIGIAEAGLDLLFKPFSQVAAGAARRHDGSGLGLAICKQLVEAMGGEIGVDSVAGVGSSFWFLVPLRLAQAEERQAAGILQPWQLSILLVEDVAESALVLEALLRRSGHTVSVAATGSEALAAVAQGRFDLVLMDLQMPGMDGFETTRRLRALPDPEKARVPVFALTASVLRDTLAKCLAAGMEDVVGKPLRMEQLNAKLVARFGGAAVPGSAGEPAAEAAAETPLDVDVLTRYRQAMGSQALLKVTALYRDNSIERLERIRQAADRGDLVTVAATAHMLAGSSGSLGLRDFGALAAELENAALAGDATQVAALCGALARQLPPALDALDRWCVEAA
jgi:signal transduction histidine kinase/DNA-binding response OmpR family regulator